MVLFKKYKTLKWGLLGLGSLLLILFTFGYWFMSLIPPREVSEESTSPTDLPYVTKNVPEVRGKILAVVTSTDTMGDSGGKTGYELTELARAYYVFQANGYEVVIASPLGGKPPVIIDDEDMGVYDFAFLNDSVAQKKANRTIPIKEVIAENYEAVFFVGGKGAMFDFPENKAIQNLIRKYQRANKVIGAVCHGPAALVNVTVDNGQPLLKNRDVSGFTNEEELLLIPEAETIFPFLLQDKLMEQGARFAAGPMYLKNMSHDQNLVTGQNPWSVWAVAETMILQLGHTPKFREITDEENAVEILHAYHEQGSQKAKEMMKQMWQVDKRPIDRVLIAKHSIMGAMKGDIGAFFDIVGLVSFAKKLEE